MLVAGAGIGSYGGVHDGGPYMFVEHYSCACMPMPFGYLFVPMFAAGCGDLHSVMLVCVFNSNCC